MQTTVDIRELQERIERESSFVDALTLGMNQVIVGQKHLIESLLIGLLADGHILLEGVPGLAKTLAINTLSKLIKADFSRIQFTPDLLPADLLGTQIYSQKTEEFKVKEEFFNQSIAPVVGIDVNEASFAEKRQFIKTLADIISLRETSMVHKIINI